MVTGEPDTDTIQFDELHGELRKLIKANGLKKAIIRLRSLNNSKEIDIYERIIKAVIQVYGVTETQLYEDVGKYVATDPRRTVYVLLQKYLNYTQANIGLQFGKTREAVNWAIMEFNKMIKDNSKVAAIVSFKQKHEQVERMIETHINKKSDDNKKSDKADVSSKNKKTKD
jgi:chromosomal replication initiation ATPase DnaA